MSALGGPKGTSFQRPPGIWTVWGTPRVSLLFQNVQGHNALTSLNYNHCKKNSLFFFCQPQQLDWHANVHNLQKLEDIKCLHFNSTVNVGVVKMLCTCSLVMVLQTMKIVSVLITRNVTITQKQSVSEKPSETTSTKLMTVSYLME